MPDPELSEKVILLLVGGSIGLVSGLITTWVGHHLSTARLKQQQQRDDALRSEEREREDELRKNEIARNQEIFLRHIERENRIREIDALWRDMQRLEEKIVSPPPGEEHNVPNLEKVYNDLQLKRTELMKREGLFDT